MKRYERKLASRWLGRRAVHCAGVATLLLGLSGTASADHAQTQKITAPDGSADDFFGYSVLLSEGDLFVGAQGRQDRDGAVYVYPSGSSYESPAFIIEPPSGEKNYFGTRLLRQDDTLFISAQRSDAASVDAGAVFVYQKNASGTWTLSQTLTASSPGRNDWFGNAIAVENDRLLVGAPRRDVDGVRDVGTVYAFSRNGSGQWVESAVLLPESPTEQGLFGLSVAVSQNRALVGMPGHDAPGVTNSGLAYAYTAGSAGAWTLAQALVPDTPLARAGFGTAVAMAQGQAVVSAPNDESGGSVYALEDQEGGWAISQRLASTESFQGLQFGFSVALSPNGQNLAVGAIGATEPGFDSGEIHLFNASGSGSFASAGAPLETNDIEARDNLGSAVYLTNEQVLVAGVRADDDSGNASGSVYIFGEGENPSAPVAPLGILVLGLGGLVALRRKAQ